MRVLGISPLDKDSTASFMEDGRVVFACAEERLSRVKLQNGFPHLAVRLGFERTGWTSSSIEAVAYAFFDGDTEGRLMRDSMALDARVHADDCTRDSVKALRQASGDSYRVDRTLRIPGFESEADEFMPAKPVAKRLAYDAIARSPRLDWRAHRYFLKNGMEYGAGDHAKWTRVLTEALAEYGLAGKLRRFNHHDTHAANAFYASGFPESLIVTLDGYGSGNCGGVYLGDSGGVQALHKYVYPNSLGQFYEHVTSALGFKPSRHEGKIVGLAAYGDPEVLRRVLLERFECRDGDIVICAASNMLFARVLAQRFAKRDVAAAYQRVLEEVAVQAVRHWIVVTHQRRLVLSGGVNANVKLNQRLREIAGVDEVFVYPNMGDGGCATGAAMLVFGPETCYGKPVDTVYYGPDYSESEMQSALQAEKLEYERVEDIEDRIGQLLADARIIGRFAGRMEYGPRALGNRSVLYPAQDPAVNQWLNHQLGRTEFMPFAPAALASDARRLFKNVDGCEKAAEFMTMTFDCTDEMVAKCPAAVHVDRTARPQLVSERSNASFHGIIRSYYERTGIPALINTSFNMHEEPIVCSPGDAIRAFLQGRLDYLAMGHFLVRHPQGKQIDAMRGTMPAER